MAGRESFSDSFDTKLRVEAGKPLNQMLANMAKCKGFAWFLKEEESVMAVPCYDVSAK